MRTTTYLGLILGITIVYFAVLAKGGDTSIFTNQVALLIALGGTFAATTLSSSRQTALHALSALSRLFVTSTITSKQVAEELVALARQGKARGIASIDPEAVTLRDPFLLKGLHLVADGVEPERIEELLRLESEILSEKRTQAERMFRLMGTYSPMFGLVGTLIGLIQMLKGLTDPAAIGQGMSVALMATFYGVLLAGLHLPAAGRQGAHPRPRRAAGARPGGLRRCSPSASARTPSTSARRSRSSPRRRPDRGAARRRRPSGGPGGRLQPAPRRDVALQLRRPDDPAAHLRHPHALGAGRDQDAGGEEEGAEPPAADGERGGAVREGERPRGDHDPRPRRRPAHHPHEERHPLRRGAGHADARGREGAGRAGPGAGPRRQPPARRGAHRRRPHPLPRRSRPTGSSRRRGPSR